MKVAIIGATGAVGREMIQDLESCSVKSIDLTLFASPRTAGNALMFRGKTHTVLPFKIEQFKGFDVALMSAGSGFSKEFARKIAATGCYVIDNSSTWRMEADCPLVVPEVNPQDVKSAKKSRIIANPNCSTIQMVVALKPLHDNFTIEMVQVATYQSVSGTGQKGIKELADQIEHQMQFKNIEPKVYAQLIAYNVLPAIDVLDGHGHCGEETKMVRETQRIMNLPDLFVMATTARVPTFNCHSEAVSVKLKSEITREQAFSVLKKAPGLTLVEQDDHAEFPTGRKIAGDQSVWVSRVRLPFGQTKAHWLQFWVVADNLKKGAATNAVQILELLVNEDMVHDA